MTRTRLIVPVFFLLLAMPFAHLYADSATDAATLQAEIDARSKLIAQLEADIASYQGKIGQTDAQAKTLKNAIASINLQIQKLQTQISSTQTKISKSDLTIQSLANTISTDQGKIVSDKVALIKSLQEAQAQENQQPIESFLANQSFSTAWQQLDSLDQFRQGIHDRVADLKAEEASLQGSKQQTQAQKDALLKFKSDLADQQKLVVNTKTDKSTLLTQTKNQESQYQALLDQKKAQEAATEQELFNYQAQLKNTVDPNSIPPKIHGILSWPIANPYVTQLFGKTADSGRLYASGSHDGVDFRASVGTPIGAVLGGTVTATGNTDLVKNCYSYGKWVLVDHHNGMSSIYGHLSLIKVVQGQDISTGDLIGYSGRTGYSLGSHLHLGLFATQGIQIAKYVNSIGCKNAVIPLSPIQGYLDPMAYLPTGEGGL